MGGKKKLSLKQMERLQRRRGESEKEKKRKEKEAAQMRDKKSGVFPPDPNDQNVANELKRMRVLTPYTVASRLNIRISAAKDLLEQLEAKGVVQMVSGNHSLKIYKPAG